MVEVFWRLLLRTLRYKVRKIGASSRRLLNCSTASSDTHHSSLRALEPEMTTLPETPLST